MKMYTLTRVHGGSLELRAESEVLDRDAKGRTTGSHIETEITSQGYDIGNASQETRALALAIMRHYYGASDPAAEAEAQRRVKAFLEGFLLHHQMPLGARYEISSNVLDSFFASR